MKHAVLIAGGKRDDRGNIFKPSREKAASLAGMLPNIINKSAAFVYDGTAGTRNTLRCVLSGAGLPDDWSEFQEYERLCAAYPEGPTPYELTQSHNFLMDLNEPNVVVCVDLSYLRPFAEHILDRPLKYSVEEADAVVITFGEDGRTPDTHNLVSPYVG